MRINYRFFGNFEKQDVLEFKTRFNIDISEGCDAFVVYEDDPIFEQVKARFGESWLDSVSVIDTDFTEKERGDSHYLSIAATKMLGYPQPEGLDDYDEDDEEEPEFPFDIYPYFENVFEVARTDHNYGMITGKQVGSFSLLGEPKWGKSNIGSIFWSGDVYFTTPTVYKTVFEPLGIKSCPVLGYGNQKPLTTVVQLLPQGISKAKLKIEEASIREIINVPSWDLKKYILNGKGFFPSFDGVPGDYDYFVSQEYFGDGGCNEKAVFVSQKLYSVLKKHGIKGLNYYPQKIDLLNTKISK